MKLDEKIYLHRRQMGLSQEDLAERLGVTRQAVSKWEMGSSVPELETVVALAKVFGVTTDYLLSDSDLAPQPASVSTEPPRQDWVDRLPGFIGNLFRRYGWLIGVRLAVAGALFIGLGALACFAAEQLFGSVENVFGSATGGMYPGFAGPFFGAYNQQVSNMVANNPVSIGGAAIMVLGIIILIGGIVLAIILKKKDKPDT